MVYGLDGQEPALVAGARPGDADFGLTQEDAWGTLGIDRSDPPPARVPTERGDYAAFYRLLAHAIVSNGPVPVDAADSEAVLEIIGLGHATEAQE